MCVMCLYVSVCDEGDKHIISANIGSTNNNKFGSFEMFFPSIIFCYNILKTK